MNAARFRVTFSAVDHMFGATLEENVMSPDGSDCWIEIVTDVAHNKHDALAGLKEFQLSEHEERMRAIETTSSTGSEKL